MAKRRGNNEGSIWQERKKWRAAVSIGGKRFTRSFDTKLECRNWVREFQNQTSQGMINATPDDTLESLMHQWLEIHESILSPQTGVRYGQIIRDYIIPQLGSIKLIDLRLPRIERHYQQLVVLGLSPRSVRFVHAILHRCLNDTIRRGYLSYNPAHGAILPRSDQKEMAILDEGEVMRLLAVIRGEPHEALYHLAVKTGIRKGELLALKWSDLDWNKGMLRIQRQVQRVHGQGLVIRPPKTRSGRRTIQLGENTLDILRVHFNRQQTVRELAGERWQDHSLIFPSTIGTHLGGSNILKDFKKQIEKANIPPIRFHDLRHTAASLLLNHGVPVLVVSKILGHAKTSTTLDIYGHLIPVMQEEAARIMDEITTLIPVSVGVTQDTKISK